MNQVVETTGKSSLAEVTTGQAIVFSSMGEVMQLAKMMAQTPVVIPKHLLNNEGACTAIIMQAQRWGMDAFAVAQKTHEVNGSLGYEAQLVNAVITSMAPTQDRLNYEWFGDWTGVDGKTCKDNDKGVRVFATMKGESEPRVLEITMAQVGVRNSPLWKDDPRQQIAYLGSKRWARLHCPDVLLGVYTPDELQDNKIEREVGPGAQSSDLNVVIKNNTEDAEVVIEETEVVEDDPQPCENPEAEGQNLTYAMVADAINQADDLETLSTVANNEVPNYLSCLSDQEEAEQQRSELMGLYKTRKGQLKAIADQLKQ